MHERAMRQHKIPAPGPSIPFSGSSSSGKVDRKDAEDIAIFGGKTRFVASSGGSTPPTKSQSPPAIPLPDLSHWQGPMAVPTLPSLGRYGVQQIPSTQSHMTPSTSARHDHQQWDLPGFTDHQSLPTPSAGPEPVDFILDDSWSTFLQNYGALPPPRPT